MNDQAETVGEPQSPADVWLGLRWGLWWVQVIIGDSLEPAGERIRLWPVEPRR